MYGVGLIYSTSPDSLIQISIKVVIFVLVRELAMVLVLHGIHCTDCTQLNSLRPRKEQRWYIKTKQQVRIIASTYLGGYLFWRNHLRKGVISTL